MKAGFVFMFTDATKTERLRSHLETRTTFTEVITALRWPTTAREFCAISLDGICLHYIGIASDAYQVVTTGQRIRFTRLVPIDHPPQLISLAFHLPRKFKKHLNPKKATNGKRIPKEAWQKFIEVLVASRPSIEPEIKRLYDELEAPVQKNVNIVVEAQQQDAVMGLVKTYGIDLHDKETTVTYTGPPERKPKWLQTHIKNSYESKMLMHDSQRFLNWERLKQEDATVFDFKSGEKRVRVTMVHEFPLETATGVDLICYHHTYRSFVMIQYKRMTQEGTTWVYRPSGSYAKELETMEVFANEIKAADQQSSDWENYRLNSDFFYFKLCPSEEIQQGTRQVKGMYLPLEYWKLLFDSGQASGKQGGPMINHANAGRHFSNTEFTDLLKKGWIGSRGVDEELIDELMTAAAEERRAVMVGEHLNYI